MHCICICLLYVVYYRSNPDLERIGPRVPGLNPSPAPPPPPPKPMPREVHLQLG